MSNINVWTYQEKYQDKTYWRTDIVTKEGEINGLILKIDDVGKCIDVCRPEMETLEDTRFAALDQRTWTEIVERIIDWYNNCEWRCGHH